MSIPIVGPVPPFTNPPINPQFYQPSNFVISAISLGLTTTVTTSVVLNFVVGQLCRLIIPPASGTRELNEMQGIVLSLPTTSSVELNINSSGFTPFILTSISTPAQIKPIGDYNQGQINTSNINNLTNIPGSFINISPN